MQRIFSARSAEVAQAACFWAAGGYLLMGLLPIGTGLTASLLLHQVPEEGILTAVAGRILSAPLQIIFLLAIISAVLSTIVSAVMAPAAVLAHNLVEPLAARRWGKLSSAQALLLQRGAVVTIASASVLLALSGRGAFELVQDAYAMSLVGMFVPFVAGILCSRVPAAGASCALLVGTSCWLWHVLMGWEFFGGPALAGVIAVPHELADTLLSGIAFCACLLPPFSRRASGLES
jgi:Na+/proline symporter